MDKKMKEWLWLVFIGTMVVGGLTAVILYFAYRF